MKKRNRIGLIGSTVLVAGLLASWTAHGAALSAGKDTPMRSGNLVRLGVADGVTLYAGGMVAVSSTGAGAGFATNATTAAGIIIGRAEKTVDNSSGTNDQLKVDVRQGIFGWVNAGDISSSNLSDICYVVDDQTVSVATSGANSVIAGTVFDVDDDYVYVLTRDIDRTAGSFTTLSVSGAATLQGAVSVGGAWSSSNSITLTHGSAAATISAIGFEGSVASLVLDADQGDDNDDTWTIDSETDGQLSFSQHTTEEMMLDAEGDLFVTGDLTVTGGDIFMLSSTNGRFAFQDNTQLVFIAGIITNVLDSDIGAE
jgi:hypothetical protein